MKPEEQQYNVEIPETVCSVPQPTLQTFLSTIGSSMNVGEGVSNYIDARS